MAINYANINDQILKIARGLGFSVTMYDEWGKGPISSARNAKYIYLEPEGILISMPISQNDGFDEIVVYIGNISRDAKFINCLQRIRQISRFNALGVTLRKFNSEKVTPSTLAHEARAKKENQNVK